VRSLVGSAVRALAATPVPFVSSKLQVPRQLSGSPEQAMQAYGSVGTLFAIVNRLSNATSQVDWHLWRKAASGLDEDRVEVTSHAAIDLWEQPNPWMPRQLFVEGTQQHVELTGEGWWVLSRSGRSSLPISMFYVRPDRIAPVPHATKYLAGYVYKGPDGEKVPLEVNEVIQLRMPNPLDQYRGLGPVQAALVDVQSSAMAAEWNRNFFLNDATPGGIIEVDRRLGDVEWKEFTERWREQHQGVANAHRVAVLEQGSWVKNAFSMRDMQFTELRRLSSEQIREAFGYPKPLLGSVDDVNRANAEAAEVVFARWLLTPRLERIKGALNTVLLPLYGPEQARALEWDYEDPTPQDTESEMTELTARVEALVALLGAGVAPADACGAVGLPEMAIVMRANPTGPAAGGDPTALAELVSRIYLSGALPAQLAAPAAPAHHHGGHDPEALAPAHNGHRHNGHAVPALPAPRAQDEPDPLPADPVRQRQLAAVQSDWEGVLNRLWGDWGNVRDTWYQTLTGQVREAVEAGDTERLAEMTVNADDGAELLASAMRQLATLAAQRVVEEAADQQVQIEPAVPDVEAIGALARATAVILGQNTAQSAGREALRRQAPGSTADEVANGVAEFLSGLTGALDREQLGGALTGAQNNARMDTMLSGPEAAYYADETLDSNTCTPCRFVDGKWLGNTIAQVRLVYPNGGYMECEGRQRCRGTVVAIWRGGSDTSEWIEKEAVDVGAAAWG